ncbi:MAG: 2-amino-4-hydroxy-6-hydroxymethyldihydropteridine diphosphokinase, partial [Rhodothermales bacterium]|nr:2-amino-4-hydroxy-6-hydroxymethyldihydropteridine diphosphokinase [Rhodothermales bacterium]
MIRRQQSLLEVKAYIGLGSNIEPRVRHLMSAVHRLSRTDGITVDAVSSVYASAAHTLDSAPQPDYLNAVIRASTSLEAEKLLDVCRTIERELGRRGPAQRWAPRQIDLDILLYGEQVVGTDRITVPHPRLRERLFVLIPLSEVLLNPLAI